MQSSVKDKIIYNNEVWYIDYCEEWEKLFTWYQSSGSAMSRV